MVSQSHIRLEKEQNYHNQICLSCIAGCYGCRWKRYRRSKDPSSIREKSFAGVATLSFMCATVWLYYWVIADNDKSDFNRFIAVHTHSYLDWFSLFYALTIVAVVYTGSLVAFAVSHLVIGLQLHLHWSHKFLVIGNIAGSIVSAILLGMMWPQGFSLLAISFHITGPFLQISAVVIVTGIGWLVCSNFFKINNQAGKYSLMATYAILVLFVYLSPLLLYAPCIKSSTMHPRPKVMAHKGAPQLAPENTRVSFETSLEHNVSGFESDVSISSDGQLFLLHDLTFEMTTNVAEKFSERVREPASNFSWEDIQKLDAGSWYLERDPFGNARLLTSKKKDLYKGQKVMLLKDLLDLATRHNKSVVFDLRRPHKESDYHDNYINHTIAEISEHKDIHEFQIWWLVGEPSDVSYIRSIPDDFLITAEGGGWDVKTLNRIHVTNVNAEYSEVSDNDISKYSSANITSNIYQVGKRWMFSLYWCEGATSVTSSACQTMTTIQSPHSFVSPGGYLALWIAVDVISATAIVAFFFLHRRHHYVYLNNPEAISLNSGRHRYGQQTRQKSDRELLFGAKKKSSPQGSEGDSPVRTPQEMMNAEEATQKDSLPANEVVGLQLQ